MIPAELLPPLVIAVPMIAACLLLPLGRHLPRLAVDLIATSVAALDVALAALLVHATSAGRVISWSGGWRPEGGHTVGIVLVADAAGAGLALLICVLVVAALLFGWRYFEDVHAHYHSLLLLFVTGMLGFALTGDLFDMFVFFELMGAVAYALTGFHVEEPESVQAGFAFGVVNSLGAYLALIGLGLLYARTGELGLAQLGAALHGMDALVVAGFALVATGWLVKAAAVPFHFWLADAHAVAPAPVCLLFSGVMAPLGVYGVGRVYWVVFAGVLPPEAAHRLFVTLGVLTAVVGAVMCFSQRHIKRMLAYSTIAHIGLFLIGLSTLDPQITSGAGVYLLGHAGAKAALFLLAGVLLSRYRSVDEAGLHGRARSSRFAGALFLLGGLVLAGLPPFGTALGKAALEESGPAATVLLLAVSVLTGGAVLRAGLRVFFGAGPAPREGGETTSGENEEPDTERTLRRTPVTMLASAAGLLVLSLVVGVLPSVATAAGAAGAAFTDHGGYLAQVLYALPPVPAHAGHPHWTATSVLLGLVTAALALALALLVVHAGRLPEVARRLARPLRPAMTSLHRLHSGHVGDYVAWLVVGVSAVAGLLLL